MNGKKATSDFAEEVAAGVGGSVDRNKNLFVVEVGGDQGAIVFGDEDNAAAPVGLSINALVHFDDEAGDDALGEYAVMVLEAEGIVPVVAIEGGGGFFGEEVGDENLLVVDGETEFKFFHHGDDELVFVVGVGGFGEDLIEAAVGEDAFVFGHQGRVVDDFVDGGGDPFGVDDLGIGH